MRTFFVYILASHSRRLYTGVTSDLRRRLWQHRFGCARGFTRRYHIHRLVYFETTNNSRSAITREKHLKRMHRQRKLALIERDNAGWVDLAAGWFE